MKPVQIAAGYLACAAAATLVLLLSGSPYRPHTGTGWIAFFLFSLPLLLAAEAAANWAWGNRLARKIESETAGQALSWRRLAYALLIMLAVVAASGWMSSLLTRGTE